MDHEQLRSVVEEYRELEHKEMELCRQQHSKLYQPRTPEVHSPLAFASLDDAQNYYQLSVEIDDIHTSKEELADQLHKDGIPKYLWIKVEGPEAPDEGATAIQVQNLVSGAPDKGRTIEIEDWTTILDEGIDH